MNNIIMEITINNTKYECKIFNVHEILDLEKTNPKFIKNLETSIKTYKSDSKFQITDLIEETKTYRPDANVYLFVLHKKNTIVATMRVYIYKRKIYINLVHTTEKYRGKGICQALTNFMIEYTRNKIKLYELEVLDTNIPAIKCYEKNGFVFIKKINYGSSIYNLMKLKLTE